MEPEENGDRSGEQGAGQMDEQEVIERETRARWESLRPSYNEWAADKRGISVRIRPNRRGAG